MRIQIITAALFLFACQQGQSDIPAKESASSASAVQQTTAIERSRIPVQTEPIQLRPVQNVYRASAIIMAIHDVEILLSIGDTVASVDKYAGDSVQAGEVIATLVSPDLQFELQTAKVEAEEAKRLHGISDELFKKKHIARDRFEETRIQQENARIALAKIRDKVSQLTVRAPFAGTIVYNDLQIGAHRTSFNTRAPIRIVDDTTLQGTFSLPVLHRANIQEAMSVNMRTRGFAEQASITRLSPVVDQNTGTILIYFELENSDQKFFSGERVAIEVPLGAASERLVLPPDSLVFEGNDPFVYIPRQPTEKEVGDDLKTIQSNEVAMPKENAAPTEENSDAQDPQALRDLLAKIPRAKKVAVAIDQLPTGEYALRADQEGEAKALTNGSEVVVIGLYQLGDAAKLKVVETL